MALFGLGRRRLCLAKTKTPPPIGSGVQEIGVIDLEPDRRAAQQQVLQNTIHADTSSHFRRESQTVFCCSPANDVA